jgi:hypothetical protein
MASHRDDKIVVGVFQIGSPFGIEDAAGAGRDVGECEAKAGHSACGNNRLDGIE